MDYRFIGFIAIGIAIRLIWKYIDNYIAKSVAYIPRNLQYLRQKRADKSQKTTINSLLKAEPLSLPGIYTQPSLDLSIVIPSYNEEERLPDTLEEIIQYVEDRKSKSNNKGKQWTYEILVVDDGSKDKTSNVAIQIAHSSKANIKVIKLDENVGKGGAVRAGCLCASGALILMADADGATPFKELDKLEKQMQTISDGDFTHPAVVIGSRAHLQNDAVAKRSLFRNILMHGFHWMVHLFGVGGIRDTQCGFKLFTRRAAAELFTKMHVERWAFDVEILYLAQQCKMSIEEVDVNWTEMPGSKLVPFWSWLEMGRDVLLIRYLYTVGHWRNELPQ